ncbi:hypothetical protein GLOIN_2v1575993 [Rhizophagus irregularis DAOM 181602=DAOM 197198]|uniref:Uncharacterized protein n=1 Tax=Rhizophagus irregularis (strain DAOM 181602 / DAOM 197198 / MUCL 43194) TaxID=747089 RepID=A0A2P4Q9Y9_RHIID|nr:hypothetical protein GLOIN_2v1575993 [Rhizophagus irregularis DAOM 181602=DAOM 197198]POG74465.1 hypothetical protein GLOIN_2v1575993 [Rhizophagus irregularis DAOM 181602=DAOM 197198]|eukprot:XP_025181331.1 hypothetical protein GLOIN_2v1575993 [Rhizophagus irregularis DAOM 181602=DAOM 197198]
MRLTVEQIYSKVCFVCVGKGLRNTRSSGKFSIVLRICFRQGVNLMGFIFNVLIGVFFCFGCFDLAFTEAIFFVCLFISIFWG